jgi:hypothetical protein
VLKNRSDNVMSFSWPKDWQDWVSLFLGIWLCLSIAASIFYDSRASSIFWRVPTSRRSFTVSSTSFIRPPGWRAGRPMIVVAGSSLLREAFRAAGSKRCLKRSMRKSPTPKTHDGLSRLRPPYGRSRWAASAASLSYTSKRNTWFGRLGITRTLNSRQPGSLTALAAERLENASSKTEAAPLAAAPLDQFATTMRPGQLEILDIDDTMAASVLERASRRARLCVDASLGGDAIDGVGCQGAGVGRRLTAIA